MPSSAALRAAVSAATCAANGVPLRDPLNPHCPALDHTSTFPCGSVIVTIVLLNVEWMWRTPSETTRFALRRRAGAASAAAAFAAPPSGCSFAMVLLGPAYFAGAIFFPATVLRGPLRVRAFVWVR